MRTEKMKRVIRRKALISIGYLLLTIFWAALFYSKTFFTFVTGTIFSLPPEAFSPTTDIVWILLVAIMIINLIHSFYGILWFPWMYQGALKNRINSGYVNSDFSFGRGIIVLGLIIWLNAAILDWDIIAKTVYVGPSTPFILLFINIGWAAVYVLLNRLTKTSHLFTNKELKINIFMLFPVLKVEKNLAGCVGESFTYKTIRYTMPATGVAQDYWEKNLVNDFRKEIQSKIDDFNNRQREAKKVADGIDEKTKKFI